MNLDEVLASLPPRQRALVVAMTEIYGDDCNELLNALHELAARIAILSGIEPEVFAAGVKHHWDYLANIVNESV
jgi:hypothetical protein